MQTRDDPRSVEQIVEGYPYPRRFHTHKEPPKSQLKPAPIAVSASTLQDRFHKEESFLASLLAHKRRDRQEKVDDFTSEVDLLLQRIPIDMLSTQWLQSCTLSRQTREFLAESLLPQVVLGLERILRDADKRGLCDESGARSDVNFNPINRLAEFIMRNNPRYSNLGGAACATPYARGIKDVLDSLKEEMFLKSGTELAELTIASNKRKANLEEAREREAKDLIDKQRQMEPLFNCFVINGKPTVNAVIVRLAYVSHSPLC